MKTKKLIETARMCTDSERIDCHSCPYGENLDVCLDFLLTDLADLLEKLHERSKAKKVDDMEVFANKFIGFCPKCGEGVNSEMKYCPDCGQHLKWKVKE